MANTELNKLLKQQEELQKQISELKIAERQPVLDELKAKIKEYGFTAKELGVKTNKPRKATKSVKEVAEPKYKNGLFTWAGQGRAPSWMKENGKVSEALKTKYAIKK